jgi:hypothetical protein
MTVAPSVTQCAEALEAAVSHALRPGMRVVLHSLKSSPELNDVEGEVVSEKQGANGRWEVQLVNGTEVRKLSLKPANLSLVLAKPKITGEEPKARRFNGLSALVSADRRGGAVEFSKKLSLKPANLEVLSSTPLKRGAKVRLHSLNVAASYNGLIGKVRSEGAGTDGRWEVEIARAFDMRPPQVEVKLGKGGLQVTSQGVCTDDERFAHGVNVVLQGLSEDVENNGEWGTITSAAPNTDGCWEVVILKGGALKTLSLKPEHMAPEVIVR